jgi:hypothetical protein
MILNYLKAILNPVLENKRRRILWVEYVARMKEVRNAHKTSVEKLQGKIPARISRRRWENNI